METRIEEVTNGEIKGTLKDVFLYNIFAYQVHLACSQATILIP